MKGIFVSIIFVVFFMCSGIAQKSLSGVYTKSEDGYLRVSFNMEVIYEQDNTVLEFRDTIINNKKFRLLTIHYNKNCSDMDVLLLRRKCSKFEIVSSGLQKQNIKDCSFLIPFSTRYIGLKLLNYQTIKLPYFNIR